MLLRIFIGLAVSVACAHIARAEQSLELIPIDATWRYHDLGEDLGTNWVDVDYDDSGWPVGQALLADPSTCVASNLLFYPEPLRTPLGTDTNVVVTHYFRARFHFPYETNRVVLRAALLVDDGAVFYLNGIDVALLRVAAGQTYYSSATNINDYEAYYEVMEFAPGALRQGDNLLAVEVHQLLCCSSDTVFGLRLDAVWVEPIVITNQPTSLVATQGQSVRFEVGVSGSRPEYQWLKDGLPIPDATNAFLSFANTQPTNAGTYAVVASNILGAVVSSNAAFTITVSATNAPLAVVNAYTTNNWIIVQFSKSVTRLTATNVNNYSVTVLGQTNPLSIGPILYATYVVALAGISPWIPQTNYVVVVNGVMDNQSNTIAPNSTIFARSSYRTDAVFFPWETEWRHRRDPMLGDLSGQWTMVEFDDTDWLGPSMAPFPGSSNDTNFIAPTCYFRKKFVVTNDVSTATLNLAYRDNTTHAVFYLNGKEFYRHNMNPGWVTYNTFGLSTPSLSLRTTNSLRVSNLMKGTNVLAVEVHQEDVSRRAYNPSRFASFEVALSGSIIFSRPPVLPPLSIARQAENLVVSWEGAGFTLESAHDVSGPWTALETTGQSYTLAASGAPQFFRLSIK